MKSLRRLTAAVAVVASAIVPAKAADVPAGEGASEQMWDVAFGAAITTDYISRGITQTEHGPAVQGYVEPSFGILYAGLWASNVSFEGVSDVEIDLYAGIRPEFDRFAFDFGYVHDFYAHGTVADYGELYGKLDVTVVDPVTVGAQVFFAPDYAQSGTSAVYAEANAEVSLPMNLGISGAIGHQNFDEAAVGPSYVTWNAGIFWTWNDTVKIDLRYSDTNLSADDCGLLTAVTNACDARVLATLSIDTSLSALRGGN